MDNFILILGESSPVLPGKTWTEYSVEVLDDKMICTAKKDASVKVEISYSSFKTAEFGIANGNLWLQCILDKGELNFCSPRKCWKSEVGKKLISCIDKECPIEDMKQYKQYTGKFWFIAMFK